MPSRRGVTRRRRRARHRGAPRPAGLPPRPIAVRSWPGCRAGSRHRAMTAWWHPPGHWAKRSPLGRATGRRCPDCWKGPGPPRHHPGGKTLAAGYPTAPALAVLCARTPRLYWPGAHQSACPGLPAGGHAVAALVALPEHRRAVVADPWGLGAVAVPGAARAAAGAPSPVVRPLRVRGEPMPEQPEEGSGRPGAPCALAAWPPCASGNPA